MRPWARITLAWIAAFTLTIGFAAYLAAADGWDHTRYTWATLIMPVIVALALAAAAVAYSVLTLERRR